ncbi:MAG: hypothetical protein H6Q48_842 [Deltaproteobacteria bacterium]|nr:hypothetical protein [Deltaproteobacteria bacterium]
MYASLFEVSGALHLEVFEQPEQKVFFSNLLVSRPGSSFNLCVPRARGEVGRTYSMYL